MEICNRFISNSHFIMRGFVQPRWRLLTWHDDNHCPAEIHWPCCLVCYENISNAKECPCFWRKQNIYLCQEISLIMKVAFSFLINWLIRINPLSKHLLVVRQSLILYCPWPFKQWKWPKSMNVYIPLCQ